MSVVSGFSIPPARPIARPMAQDDRVGLSTSPSADQLALLALALRRQDNALVLSPTLLAAPLAPSQLLMPIPGPIPLSRDPLTSPASIPDEGTIKARMNWRNTSAEGALRGTLIGAALSPLLLGLNYVFQKPSLLAAPFIQENLPSEMATNSAVQTVEESGLALLDAVMGFVKLPDVGRSLRQRIADDGLARHAPALLADMAGTVVDSTLLGAALGAGVALMQVGEVKDRLINIGREQQGQAPIHANPLRLWLARRDRRSPEEKLQTFKAGALDEQGAFAQGVKNTIILKGIIGGGSTLLSLAALIPWLAFQKSQASAQPFREVLWPTTKQVVQQVRRTLTSMIQQPLFGVQLVMLPVMGGIIAKQLVPWMNHQLGREPQSLPSTTPPISTHPWPVPDTPGA